MQVTGDALWDLTATAPGTIDRLPAEPDTDVSADQWLALAVP